MPHGRRSKCHHELRHLGFKVEYQEVIETPLSKNLVVDGDFYTGFSNESD